MSRQSMLEHIDAKAGAVRSTYITVAPGQEATYILKAAQAEKYKDSGYTGTAPGLVKAEAAATNETYQQATDRILYEQELWSGLSAMIEEVRRTAKVSIVNAATDEDAELAYNTAIHTLKAMM